MTWGSSATAVWTERATAGETLVDCAEVIAQSNYPHEVCAECYAVGKVREHRKRVGWGAERA
jgi:hypothetical protein